MQVYNTTNSDSADTIIATYHLTSSSPFYQVGYTLSDPTKYRYIMTARFLDWYQVTSGNSYKIKLSWINPSNPFDTNSVDYSWTISLTSAQQEQEQDNTQQQINQGINDMNNFLTDDSFSQDTILNNMPNSDQYTDPADGGLFTIFNALQTAFTSESTTPVRFYIPFSNNQYIDLPADLTTSHIPQPILFLIQMVYWFVICRFIIKDISNTANKTKSGELLDSKEGNIRTELL